MLKKKLAPFINGRRAPDQWVDSPPPSGFFRVKRDASELELHFGNYSLVQALTAKWTHPALPPGELGAFVPWYLATTADALHELCLISPNEILKESNFRVKNKEFLGCWIYFCLWLH